MAFGIHETVLTVLSQDLPDAVSKNGLDLSKDFNTYWSRALGFILLNMSAQMQNGPQIVSLHALNFQLNLVLGDIQKRPK